MTGVARAIDCEGKRINQRASKELIRAAVAPNNSKDRKML